MSVCCQPKKKKKNTKLSTKKADLGASQPEDAGDVEHHFRFVDVRAQKRAQRRDNACLKEYLAVVVVHRKIAQGCCRLQPRKARKRKEEEEEEEKKKKK